MLEFMPCRVGVEWDISWHTRISPGAPPVFGAVANGDTNKASMDVTSAVTSMSLPLATCLSTHSPIWDAAAGENTRSVPLFSLIHGGNELKRLKPQRAPL